jgi:glutamate synthase (NADPH) small chain
MGNPRGFIEIDRKEPGYRTQEERTKDFKEVEKRLTVEETQKQAERCMDCGIPFCHGCGCPLSNLIPEWNDLVAEGKWEDAFRLLSSTNNFPEFTGRICPAPCETSCTAGLGGDAVSIRQIELNLIENAYEKGYFQPQPPEHRTGEKIAIVGSGPAGLALADCLNKSGHQVTVYEKNQKAGGLLRYGIPDFKLEKKIIDRRLDIMIAEGVNFETSVCIGTDIFMEYLQNKFDTIAITVGAETPRDLNVPGRDLNGVHFAMDFLMQQNRRVVGEKLINKPISAKGKNVVVIGGGDTGSDCVGTSIRQGAKSVTQIEIMPEPPAQRSEFTPWPEWPYSLRTSSSHKEGCKRQWDIMTASFIGKNAELAGINAVKVEWEIDKNGRPSSMKEVPDSEFKIDAELVLLAMGFTGPLQQEQGPILQMNLDLDKRGNILVDENGMTSEEGIFAAGDAASGASLVVRAMIKGRELAASIDAYLKK